VAINFWSNFFPNRHKDVLGFSDSDHAFSSVSIWLKFDEQVAWFMCMFTTKIQTRRRLDLDLVGGGLRTSLQSAILEGFTTL
jgi:hypothetical protein